MALPRLLLGALVAGVAVSCAAGPVRVVEARYAAHVAWLADDARQGREAGTQGYEDAADYAAAQLQSYGLEPLGDKGGWFQAFEASGNRELIAGNRLTIAGDELSLERDYVPFASAPTGQVSGPATFVGYGMVDVGAPDGSGAWDDYADVDVEGRVVVVLRGGPLPPGAEPGTGRWLAGEGQRHITTFAKINAAYKAGAAGIVIVNDPRGYDRSDLHPDLPIPYRTSFRGATASLPAVSVSFAAAQRVFGPRGLDLAQEQRLLDERQAPRSRDLEGLDVALTVAAAREAVTTWNVVGRLPGRDAGGEHVIIGAHLDHLGLGRHGGSMAGADAAGQIHNGADDNASGSAGVLEIARALSERPTRPDRDLVFVLFGAEEWGLLGSRHYVERPALPLDRCVAMINMDMIGRSVDGEVIVGGVGTAEGLLELVDDALDELAALRAATTPSVSPNSDHQPFFEAGVPVLSLFTGLHEDYHLPSDDAEAVDTANGARIAALGAGLALRLAALGERPAFVDPDAASGPGHASTSGRSGSGRGYSVSFGSLPDMTDTSDRGLRLRGTREGSPAERCGLLAGDVIVAMDGKPIRNLQDYAVLLFSHQPGDVITLTVDRDGETLELTATLDAPRGET